MLENDFPLLFSLDYYLMSFFPILRRIWAKIVLHSPFMLALLGVDFYLAIYHWDYMTLTHKSNVSLLQPPSHF